jgi:hypothetical protein
MPINTVGLHKILQFKRFADGPKYLLVLLVLALIPPLLPLSQLLPPPFPVRHVLNQVGQLAIIGPPSGDIGPGFISRSILKADSSKFVSCRLPRSPGGGMGGTGGRGGEGGLGGGGEGRGG